MNTHFIVTPFDLDLNFHMNNGKFFSLMDLGRMDILLSTGSFKKIIFNGYYPVVVSEVIRFKRSLSLFQKFYIETSIEGWDDRDFYMKQDFISNGEIVATAMVKARFKKRGQKLSVSSPDLLKFLGISKQMEPIPAIAQHLKEIDQIMSPKK